MHTWLADGAIGIGNLRTRQLQRQCSPLILSAPAPRRSVAGDIGNTIQLTAGDSEQNQHVAERGTHG